MKALIDVIPTAEQLALFSRVSLALRSSEAQQEAVRRLLHFSNYVLASAST